MPFLLITAMTVFAIGLFLWLIAASQHTNLYSLRNLFLAVWVYYGFAVGIDLLTGAEIPYMAGEVYMMDSANWPKVAFVTWCYVMCGIAFVLTYSVMQGGHKSEPIKLQYELSTPPEWALVLLHLMVAYFYVETFFGLDRMARLAMSQQFASYKFGQLAVPLVLAVDTFVIWCGSQRKALVAVALALFLSLVTGNRSYVLLVVLIATFHWQPAMRGWKLVGIVSGCAFMVFAFKTVYAVGIGWYLGDRVDMGMVYENLHPTLSGLDADASFSIAVFYTHNESPMWLGSSYITKPFMLAWPRFLGGGQVSTLAEDYVWAYHTATAKRGGALAFSAIAESWLNFSYMGPILMGVFWGAVTNFFDRRPRGVAYFIVVLMVARLFRSDAASLSKNWILVWGAMFAAALLLLTVYSALVEPKYASIGQLKNLSGQTPTLGKSAR